MAELGCDVVKIEKPGGDPGRMLGPFHAGKPDPVKNLAWFAYNTSKKDVALNSNLPRGREFQEAQAVVVPDKQGKHKTHHGKRKGK